MKKIYDQKGNWGVVISSEEIAKTSLVASVEEDDFTIELTEKEINVEVSTIDNESLLGVWVYFGPNLEPDKYKLVPNEIASFIQYLDETGNVQTHS